MYKIGTAGPVSTTIATITAGAGQTSFTVTSSTGLPTLAAGDFSTARIADGTGSAENITITAISGATITCLATAFAHAAGNIIDFDVLTSGALVGLLDDAIAGTSENLLTAAGALLSGTGATNRITITLAGATFTLADGTYKGELCRVFMDRSSTKLATIDPAGTTTINGTLTYVMWAGESAYFAWSGTGWDYLSGVRRAMEASMYQNANQTGVVNYTPTKVNLNTIDLDNTGLMANTGTSRLTVLRGGSYKIDGAVWWAGFTAASPRCITMLYKNGAQVMTSETSGTVDSYPSPTAFKKLMLVAGDYIELFGLQASGANHALLGAAGNGSTLALTETLQ